MNYFWVLVAIMISPSTGEPLSGTVQTFRTKDDCYIVQEMIKKKTTEEGTMDNKAIICVQSKLNTF